MPGSTFLRFRTGFTVIDSGSFEPGTHTREITFTVPTKTVRRKMQLTDKPQICGIDTVAACL